MAPRATATPPEPLSTESVTVDPISGSPKRSSAQNAVWLAGLTAQPSHSLVIVVGTVSHAATPVLGRLVAFAVRCSFLPVTDTCTVPEADDPAMAASVAWADVTSACAGGLLSRNSARPFTPLVFVAGSNGYWL